MMHEGMEPVRVALVGTSKRSAHLYAPLLRGMPQVALVGVWGRSEEGARRVGELAGAPAYTDLDRLKRETGAEAAVVAVSYAANGEVGLLAVEAGLHALLETPIAHDLAQADAIIRAARERNLRIEVAEQFHRRPLEQLKLRLLESGLFGRVHTAFNDFAGHGYHGVSVLRSYIGFGERPVLVQGAVRSYPLAPTGSPEAPGRSTETQEHGIVFFEGGQLGIFHWTDVGYGSPLRWWRSGRFLAERGMGISVGVGIEVEERLSLLAPGGEAPRFVTVERRYERVDGGALSAMVAHSGDPELPVVRWENPLAPAVRGHGPHWHDDEIGVGGCVLSLVEAIRSGGEPSYGAEQGRLDQELILAIRKSSDEGGRPVELPLAVGE